MKNSARISVLLATMVVSAGMYFFGDKAAYSAGIAKDKVAEGLTQGGMDISRQFRSLPEEFRDAGRELEVLFSQASAMAAVGIHEVRSWF